MLGLTGESHLVCRSDIEATNTTLLYNYCSGDESKEVTQGLQSEGGGTGYHRERYRTLNYYTSVLELSSGIGVSLGVLVVKHNNSRWNRTN
jgi:hypothetical protein